MRITYKLVLFNEKTGELGIPVRINGMMLIDVGYSTGFKPFVDSEWIIIGAT